MNIAGHVKNMEQRSNGVDVNVQGQEIIKSKMEVMAAKCAPGGPGCADDCCDEDFKSRLAGVEVDGIDGDVTMHIRGAIKAAEVGANLSRCNCYDT